MQDAAIATVELPPGRMAFRRGFPGEPLSDLFAPLLALARSVPDLPDPLTVYRYRPGPLAWPAGGVDEYEGWLPVPAGAHVGALASRFFPGGKYWALSGSREPAAGWVDAVYHLFPWCKRTGYAPDPGRPWMEGYRVPKPGPAHRKPWPLELLIPIQRAGWSARRPGGAWLALLLAWAGWPFPAG